VAFVYVNGLNLVKFEEWYKFQGLVGNDAVYRHLQVLFRSFQNRHYKLNAWQMLELFQQFCFIFYCYLVGMPDQRGISLTYLLTNYYHFVKSYLNIS
jgi:hypothetical protein